ncbi:hypothetical protein LNV09_14150 [Paucibacter sp. B2R-40]|jgi:hypothetical protein|uniref:hypothetical protein n=1 Tax=Paucibacter sp. B2R-40 TaxID=2893554 RepID=UPI0021E462BC|nr:hypothetical protein [Paucibacter sp. B2R-40]MCV2355294.1 hypothetical protein [Paucibacter sp. B2R-40]
MNTSFVLKQSLAAALLLSLSLSALAASSTASSASEGASSAASSGSKSLEASSGSSTKGDKVAAGNYKIIDVAAAADRPGMVRVHLQAAADDFYLVLPEPAFEKSQLVAGQLVTARQHAYGLEFANHQTQQAFFLVLSDEWYRELDSRAVVL